MKNLALLLLTLVTWLVVGIVSLPIASPNSVNTFHTNKRVTADVNSDIQSLHNSFFPSNYGSASTAILFRNETIGEYFAGLTNPLNASSLPTRNTKYRIASLTKTFVSAAMMILRDEGLLDLDQSVVDFLPELSKLPNPYNFSSDLTFRQLSSHLSGLPREPPCILFECEFNTSQIMDRVKSNGLFLVRNGDEFPIYSNLGYSLLGHALEAAAGEKFEDIVTSRILNRLGMTNSGFVTKDVVNKLTDFASGFHGKEFISTFNKSIGWSQPAAGLYSTLGDLQLYVKALMGNVNNQNWMKLQTLREFLNPVQILPHGSGAIGLSWEMVFYPSFNTWAIMKSGLIGGFNAHIAMFPEFEFSVVSMLSVDDGAQSLCLQTASLIFGQIKARLENVKRQELLDSLKNLNNLSQYSGVFNQTVSVKYNETLSIEGLKGQLVTGGLAALTSDSFKVVIPVQRLGSLQQYVTGLSGSVVTFSADRSNITLYDLSFNQFYTKTSNVVARSVKKRSVTESKVELTSVCDLITNDLKVKDPMSDVNIVNAMKILNTTVKNMIDNYNASAYLKINYKGNTLFETAIGNVSDTSIFRIGTLTQLFTSAAVLILREKKLIPSLDDPVSKYTIPSFSEVSPFASNMTIRQLLMHASGLPSGTPCDVNNCYMDWNSYIGQASSTLRLIQPSFGPRTFSTVGYAILGNIVSSVSGKTLEVFVKENILDPLQMQDTGFSYTSTVTDRLVPGKTLDGHVVQNTPTIDPQLSSHQMYSTAADLSKFLNCVASVTWNCTVLKKFSTRMLLQRSYLSNDLTFSNGLGSWEHQFDLTNKVWLAVKSGAIRGYGSSVAVSESMDLNVVLLTSIDQPVADTIVSTTAPPLFKSFVKALQGTTRNSTMLPSHDDTLIHQMVGVYSTMDQFLLFTQFVQIAYDATNRLVTFAFVESSTPAVSSAPPTFALEVVNESELKFRVKTLDTLGCFGNVLTGMEGAVVNFAKNVNGSITSFAMPSLNYGSDFVKIVTPTVSPKPSKSVVVAKSNKAANSVVVSSVPTLRATCIVAIIGLVLAVFL